MSTRSGKRIHSTIDENVENNVEHKRERNTRSKQLKLNGDDLPLTEKKRKHYVRYPSQEDLANGNGNIENVLKNTRKSRRHTLKEQNVATDSETSNDERKVRSTRRTKKLEAADELESTESILEKDIIEGKKKGKKKKTVKASITEENIENIPEVQTVTKTKKKSNKKKNKRKSNSIIVEDISESVNKNLNKSNASNDSFHSAAGSPIVNRNQNQSINYNNVSEEPAKIRKNKKNTFDGESITSAEKPSRKRKITIEMESEVTNNHFNDNVSKESLSKLDEASCTKVNSIDSKTLENDSLSSVNKSLELSSKKRHSNKKISYDNLDNINTTFEIDNTTKQLNLSNHKLKVTTIDSTPNASDNNTEIETPKTNLNATFDKHTSNQSAQKRNNITFSGSKKKRKSSIKNSTNDKIDHTSIVNLDATFEKETETKDKKSLLSIPTPESLTKDSLPNNSLVQNNTNLNETYHKISNAETSPNFLNATFDKPNKLDTTFDKSLKKDSIDQSKMNPQAKSSLISSDTTDNSTLNITDDTSRISITSDDSKTENIVNTTPVLIESSMDESKDSANEKTFTTETKKTPLKRDGTFIEETKPSPSTREDITEAKPINIPLRRDGTFTESSSPKKTIPETKCTTPRRTTVTKTPPSTKKIISNAKSETTPLKREGTFTKDSSDVTMSPKPKLSTQLTPRRKSLPSPGCTPYPLSKNSIKEKSVLNVTRSIEKPRRSSIADVAPRMTRVMFCSPVNNPAVVTQMKGRVIKSNLKGSNKSFVFDESVSELKRPARKRSYTQSEAESERDNQVRSVERLSRPRTTSAAARLQDADTPTKKQKVEVRRTKLPNFAALHQKQFDRMESLDECVVRKAKRARHLLTPKTPTQTLRTSPKEAQKDSSLADPSTKKTETPKSKTEPNPGFTRFGFKLNLDVNPFSIPSKNTEVKPKEKKPVFLKRQATLPSLAGATILRREIAKQTIMREKSFTEKRHVKRDENRTVIKGVRTNRRFELQMKMRNINNK